MFQNCTKFNPARPQVLRNKPAECEVDQTNGSQDTRVTDRQIPRFKVRLSDFFYTPDECLRNCRLINNENNPII